MFIINLLGKYRTRLQRIQTFSIITVQFKIPSHQSLPLYQIMAPKIKELNILGMSNAAIALKLQINTKTVTKALLFET